LPFSKTGPQRSAFFMIRNSNAIYVKIFAAGNKKTQEINGF